jgi:hypothetical protein
VQRRQHARHHRQIAATTASMHATTASMHATTAKLPLQLEIAAFLGLFRQGREGREKHQCR